MYDAYHILDRIRETYTCPICGVEYRVCDVPPCIHTEAEWAALEAHEHAMEAAR